MVDTTAPGVASLRKAAYALSRTSFRCLHQRASYVRRARPSARACVSNVHACSAQILTMRFLSPGGWLPSSERLLRGGWPRHPQPNHCPHLHGCRCERSWCTQHNGTDHLLSVQHRVIAMQPPPQSQQWPQFLRSCHWVVLGSPCLHCTACCRHRSCCSSVESIRKFSVKFQLSHYLSLLLTWAAARMVEASSALSAAKRLSISAITTHSLTHTLHNVEKRKHQTNGFLTERYQHTHPDKQKTPLKILHIM